MGSLVALCPLIDLLGTVTGMLEVFDVFEQAGHANPPPPTPMPARTPEPGSPAWDPG